MRNMDIRPDDMFWKFYCKRFVLEGKEVEPPTNLCRYVQTSVKGFGLWLDREVKLSMLFFIALVATAVLFAGSWLLKDVTSVLTDIALLVATVTWVASLVTLFYSAMNRLWRWLETRPAVMNTVALLFMSFLIAVTVWGAISGTLLSDIQRGLVILFRLLGYGVAVVFTIAVVAFLLSKVPHRHRQKFQGAFQTISAYTHATKKGICPDVNPPKDFKVKK